MTIKFQRLRLRVAVLAIMLGLPHSISAQETSYAPCMMDARTGPTFSELTRYALGGVLFKGANSLFLARTVNGQVSIDPVKTPDDDSGVVFMTHDTTGGVLIGGNKRLFLARVVNDAIIVEPADDADTGVIRGFSGLSDDRVLILAKKGLFLAQIVNGKAILDLIGSAEVGIPLDAVELPGAGVLIRSQR